MRDLAIGGPRQPLVRERQTGAVAAHALKRLPVVILDHDAGVQGEALTPRAQAFDTRTVSLPSCGERQVVAASA